jgi:hypothetical protein
MAVCRPNVLLSGLILKLKKSDNIIKRIDIVTRRFNGIINDRFSNIEGLRNKL